MGPECIASALDVKYLRIFTDFLGVLLKGHGASILLSQSCYNAKSWTIIVCQNVTPRRRLQPQLSAHSVILMVAQINPCIKKSSDHSCPCRQRRGPTSSSPSNCSVGNPVIFLLLIWLQQSAYWDILAVLRTLASTSLARRTKWSAGPMQTEPGTQRTESQLLLYFCRSEAGLRCGVPRDWAALNFPQRKRGILQWAIVRKNSFGCVRYCPVCISRHRLNKLFEEDRSAIKWSMDGIRRSIHFAVRMSLLRQSVRNSDISVAYCKTEDRLAVIFTRLLLVDRCKVLRENLEFVR